MPRVDTETAAARTYDLCVIGAGAAGLAVADAARRAGRSVILLERGAEEASLPSIEPELPEGSPHDPARMTSREGLGGTLNIWGGRCVPFDREDFEPRMLDLPGWPISYDDYAAWIPGASALLGVEPVYRKPVPESWPRPAGLRLDTVERLSASWFPMALRKRVLAASGPDILLGAAVIRLRWSDSRVTGVEIGPQHAPICICASDVVLACGGLQTTRLLLEEERRTPGRLSGAGWLGRGYMGHLTGSIAEIAFASPAIAAAFAYAREEGSSAARRRILVMPDDGPHVAFWPEALDLADPRHGSGEFSLKSLLRGAPGGTRGRHLGNIAADPIGAIAGIGSALHNLGRRGSRHPSRLPARRAGTYRLVFHAEHLPSVQSRATLATSRGADGLHLMRIDFSYGKASIHGTLQAHRQMAQALEKAGFARIAFAGDDAALLAQISAAARDGYHQIGLTRMAGGPDRGVVDPQCRVFGSDNLYVASASVFPRSSQANPTLSVVALALRLAALLVARRGDAGTGRSSAA